MICSTGEALWLLWSCATSVGWDALTGLCIVHHEGLELTRLPVWFPKSGYPSSSSSSFFSSFLLSHPFSFLTSFFLYYSHASFSSPSTFSSLLFLSSSPPSTSLSPILRPSLHPESTFQPGQISFLSLAGRQTVTRPLCVLASRSFRPLFPPSPSPKCYLRKGLEGEGNGARERQRRPWGSGLAPTHS